MKKEQLKKRADRLVNASPLFGPRVYFADRLDDGDYIVKKGSDIRKMTEDELQGFSDTRRPGDVIFMNENAIED